MTRGIPSLVRGGHHQEVLTQRKRQQRNALAIGYGDAIKRCAR
jgi:hypothetical protein